MRYFKSATFLLLTASSSVSLLSHAAIAASESPTLPGATDEVTPADVEAEGEVAVAEPVEPSEVADTSFQSLGFTEAVVSPYAFPVSAEARSPQFSQLLRRLYPETFEANAETSAGADIEAIDVAFAQEATNLAREIDTDDGVGAVTDGAAVSEGAVEEAPLAEGAIEIEVLEPTVESSGEDVSFSESSSFQKLTIDSFRRLVEGNEDGAVEGEQAVVSELSQADEQAIAQSDVGQADTDSDNEDLPTLEEPEPVEPTSEEPASEPEPSDTEPSGAETPAEPDVPDAAPPLPVPSDVEINALPDGLFADPNPLSFPTLPEEVEVDRNPVVTLEEAVELAYQNNQTLQASLLALEQARAALEEARAARLPSVSTSADLTNTQNDGSRTVLGGAVQLQYNLLTGGARAASIRAAELQEQVSALTVEAQQEQIRLTTAIAYYALQDAGEQIRINQSFLDEAARNLRDSQLRQEVGVGTRFDTLRAEVQFANARQSLIQSQGDQRIARRDIARFLNLPPTAGLEATPVAVAENWPLTLEDSILQAFQNRAELEQQLLQADISEQQRQIALAAIRPQVSLLATYSAQEILEGSTAFEDDFNDSVSFSAQFNWTLYDGGAARASARQQELGGAIAEEQFSENLDQIRFDVEEAFFNLQSNEENIATSEVAVAQAQEALELANLRLQAGVGTQLDVLTAQSELTQAEANNVTAILGYNRALVAMERAVSNVSGPYSF
ncbi:MAG: TolC family protein [Cyanobacteria bacterium J06649_4]